MVPLRTGGAVQRELVDVHAEKHRAEPRGKAKEFGGLFVVRKKGGQLRVLVDARRANRRFAAPPEVEPLSTEGLSRLEVELGEDELDGNGLPLPAVVEELHATLGCTGVKDAIRRLLMPEEMPSW